LGCKHNNLGAKLKVYGFLLNYWLAVKSGSSTDHFYY